MLRKYDVKLIGNTGKSMGLDEEKLVIEEEECLVSTFTSSEGQACELINKAGVNLESLIETVVNEI